MDKATNRSPLSEVAEHILVNQYTQSLYLASNLRISAKEVHRLLETLEQIGIVGPPPVSGDRDILFSYFDRDHAMNLVNAYETEQRTDTPAATDTARRVLVTGSRAWTDTTVIRDALAAVWHPDTILVTGKCDLGADLLAEQCWTAWGGTVEPHPADWASHGRRAGFLRNTAMVNTRPDECIAFIRDHSPGATHCATAARKAGIPTTIHRAA